MPTEVRLSSPTDIAGFHAQARQLLAQRIPPESVQWNAAQGSLEDGAVLPRAEESRPHAHARAASSIVPASFVRLCEYVVQHRDGDRFALLYRLLWRLVHEPGLRHDPSDADMSRAQHMAHAVRRDIHKIKMHLRFQAMSDPERPGELLEMAWCEPAHHTVETVAPWFAKRHGASSWALFTPERSVYWDGKQLHYAPGGAPIASAAAPGEWFARWRAAFAK
ncbi:MAG TPA: TIGR03915 family putative DNA repair protein [Ramlibacter sp.]|uniref:TIGR03915 family putative DNA repair protein n=1 Tax=Ramlibacter sp. TaxID=1917967 RepID=UPI002BBB185F|nr:TIGR03915 family putative DNA repair protein [Ramlibacter sp.]HVZ46910.1 TIGR03915 family putative DNA repair protein [Ramlibacter sp.]